uniref:Uncharacterized protein n=1 Tax=Cucumis melo TaxID=3656 RepID=A0A9I9DY41_CUCME
MWLSSDGRARLTARAEEARLEEGAWLTARIEGLGSWLTAHAVEARMEVARLAAWSERARLSSDCRGSAHSSDKRRGLQLGTQGLG